MEPKINPLSLDGRHLDAGSLIEHRWWQQQISRRRLLQIGATTAFAVGAGGLLEACGGSSPSTSTGGALKPASDLVLQSFSSAYPICQKLIPTFNQQYGVTATVITIPSNYYSVTETRLLSGKPPMDVFQEDPGFLAKFYKNKWIATLDGLPGLDDLKTKMYPAVLQACMSPDGKMVALPYYTAAYVLFYNGTILDKYGMKPATTWDEMYSQGISLKQKGVATPIVPLWSTQFDLTNYSFINECVSRGMSSQFDNNFNPLWDTNAAAMDVLNYWRKLQDGNLIPPDSITMNYHQAEAVMQGGQGVYFMMDNGQLKNLNSPGSSKVAGQIKVGLTPGTSKAGAGTAFTSVYFQTTLHNNPSDAWPLMRFIGGTDKDGQLTGPIQEAAIGEGIRTGYKSTDTDPAVLAAAKDYATADDLQMFVNVAEVAVDQGPVQNETWYSAYNDLMAKTLSQFLARQISAADALKNSADQTRQVKAKAGS
jgi:ABC-type glycerol-3-phosphate transport system substrate-binding protein